MSTAASVTLQWSLFPVPVGFTQCGYQLWVTSKVTGGHCFQIHRQPYCQHKGLLDYSLLNLIKLYKQGQQCSIGCDIILVQYSVYTNLLTLCSRTVQLIVLPLCAIYKVLLACLQTWLCESPHTSVNIQHYDRFILNNSHIIIFDSALTCNSRYWHPDGGKVTKSGADGGS